MSIELFTPTDPYVIAGTGPYLIDHPYAQQSDLVVSIILADVETILPLADFSVLPLAATVTGNLTLSSGAATIYAGGTMYIRRSTVFEQGWIGQTSRENGLEALLDLATMAIQDLQTIGSRYPRLLGATPINPVIPTPEAGRLLIARTDLAGWENGPDATDIADAQTNAAIATAASVAASAAAASVVAQAQFAELGQIAEITTGTGSAYILDTLTNLTAVPLGIPFPVTFHEACELDATINIEGFGALNLQSRRYENNDLVNIRKGQIRKGSVQMCRFNGTSILVHGDLVRIEDLHNPVKSADEARALNVLGAADTDLQVNISEVGLYRCEILFWTQAGAGQLKYRFNTPANSELLLTDADTSAPVATDTPIIDTDTSGATIRHHFSGLLRTTEAGGCQVGWSQQISDPAPTTVLKNSFMKFDYIGP